MAWLSHTSLLAFPFLFWPLFWAAVYVRPFFACTEFSLPKGMIPFDFQEESQDVIVGCSTESRADWNTNYDSYHAYNVAQHRWRFLVDATSRSKNFALLSIGPKNARILSECSVQNQELIGGYSLQISHVDYPISEPATPISFHNLKEHLLSIDRKFLATAESDGKNDSVKIYETRFGNIVGRCDIEGPVRFLFSANSRHAVAIPEDGDLDEAGNLRIELFDLYGRKRRAQKLPVRQFGNYWSPLALSNDGQRIAFHAGVFELSQGDCVIPFDDGCRGGVFFSGDSKHLWRNIWVGRLTPGSRITNDRSILLEQHAEKDVGGCPTKTKFPLAEEDVDANGNTYWIIPSEDPFATAASNPWYLEIPGLWKIFQPTRRLMFIHAEHGEQWIDLFMADEILGISRDGKYLMTRSQTAENRYRLWPMRSVRFLPAWLALTAAVSLPMAATFYRGFRRRTE